MNPRWDEKFYQPMMEWQDVVSMRAEGNPLDGFAFSVSVREQNSVNQVWLQYFQPLVCGYGEDYMEELETANQRLHDADFDRYLETIQEQLADYRAGNLDGDGSEAPSRVLTE